MDNADIGCHFRMLLAGSNFVVHRMLDEAIGAFVCVLKRELPGAPMQPQIIITHYFQLLQAQSHLFSPLPGTSLWLGVCMAFPFPLPPAKSVNVADKTPVADSPTLANMVAAQLHESNGLRHGAPSGRSESFAHDALCGICGSLPLLHLSNRPRLALGSADGLIPS